MAGWERVYDGNNEVSATESGLLEGELMEFQIHNAMKKVWMESCSQKLQPTQGTVKEESVLRGITVACKPLSPLCAATGTFALLST